MGVDNWTEDLGSMEPMSRLELETSSLPRKCSTAELHGLKSDFTKATVNTSASFIKQVFGARMFAKTSYKNN